MACYFSDSAYQRVVSAGRYTPVAKEGEVFLNTYDPKCKLDVICNRCGGLCEGVLLRTALYNPNGTQGCKHCNPQVAATLRKTNETSSERVTRLLNANKLLQLTDHTGLGLKFDYLCLVCGHHGTFVNPYTKTLEKGCHACRGVTKVNHPITPRGYSREKGGTFYIFRGVCKETGKRFLKFGITNKTNPLSRQRQINHKANYRYVFSPLVAHGNHDGNLIAIAECLIKSRMVGALGYMSKQELPDGYTETLEDTPENLAYVVKHLHCMTGEKIRVRLHV